MNKEEILKGNLDNYPSDSFDSFFKKDVLVAMEEYASLQTAALQNRVKELEGELERQTMLKQQWYNLYQNALKHNL